MRRQNRWVEVRSWWAKAHPTSTLALLGLLALVLLACEEEPPRLLQQGDSEAMASAWLEVFDEMPADDPLVARARGVFERVREVSGTHADLVVLEIPGAPLALALADQTVVLSKGGLEFCYHEVPPEAGDARLAFLLGHELAHVASNDFWHASAFGTVQDVEDPTERAERLQELLRQDARDRQVIELKADDQGMLALIQADYDPRPLLEGDRTFFEDWVGGLVGSTAYDDPNHPGVQERADFLRERLKQVAAMEKVFERGVEAFRRAEELASTEEEDQVPPEVWAAYEEAVKAFDAVRRVFPGREVLSNLALAHLRLAAGRLADCDGSLVNRYYLPTAIDPVTLVSRARLRGERSYSSPCFENEGYQGHMREAIRLLEVAVARDSGYRPARLNLVAAYVLDERAAGAAEAARQARERWPDDPAVAAAWSGAILAYLDTGSTLFDPEKVVEEVRELHRRFPAEPGIAFNLASALSHDGRVEEARPVWEDFLRVEPDGPWAKIARDWVGEERGADRVPAAR
jgi:tetratricopeptide (TPR) repeat protein